MTEGTQGPQGAEDYSHSDSNTTTVENDKTPKGLLGSLLNLDILPRRTRRPPWSPAIPMTTPVRGEGRGSAGREGRRTADAFRVFRRKTGPIGLPALP